MQTEQKKKESLMIEHLKKQTYGFCWDQDHPQIWVHPEQYEEDRENSKEAVSEIFMILWKKAMDLTVFIPQILLSYGIKRKEEIPLPDYLENYWALIDFTSEQLWGYPYGFYFDDEQGLGLWIDQEKLEKQDSVHGLFDLLERAEKTATHISDIMNQKFPAFREELPKNEYGG
jgi:hypothetical protein